MKEKKICVIFVGFIIIILTSFGGCLDTDKDGDKVETAQQKDYKMSETLVKLESVDIELLRLDFEIG